jgi:hypothetical protein
VCATWPSFRFGAFKSIFLSVESSQFAAVTDLFGLRFSPIYFHFQFLVLVFLPPILLSS